MHRKVRKKIQKHKSVIIICSLLSPTNKNIVALLSSLHYPIRENNPNNSNFHFISLLYIFSSTKQKQNHTKIHKKNPNQAEPCDFLVVAEQQRRERALLKPSESEYKMKKLKSKSRASDLLK